MTNSYLGPPPPATGSEPAVGAPGTAAGVTGAQHDHRWLVLAVIGVAQLMVVLDTTIVNIALPSAQRDLGFGTDSRQWVVTSYSLAFGSLLLLGGRLSDLMGQRRTLLIGLLGFATVSAVGGAAPSFGLLVAARGLQGLFAAILVPAALSTLNMTFTDPKQRNKALAIYAGIAGGGAAIGLILGGILTQWLSWRWCLYVNLFFAIPAAVGVLAYIKAQEERRAVRLDLLGALTASGGLFSLVYGLSNAEQHGWRDGLTIAMFVASALLLTSFVITETRVGAPLLPLRVLTDRNRAGSYLSIAMAFCGMLAAFLFLTYYLQQSLGYSPLKTGVAFLPLTVGLVTAAGLSSVLLMPRVGPRPIVPTGMLVVAGGMAWLSQLSATSTYAGGVLGPMLIFGFGMGLIVAPSMNTATANMNAADAGVISAMVNTSQQVGGAIGAATLSTIFTTAVTDYATSHPPGSALMPAAVIHGYGVAFTVTAGIFLTGALVSGLLLRSGRIDTSHSGVGAL